MRQISMIMVAAAAILLGISALSQSAPTSQKLTDTIKQGTGTIDLLKDVNAPMLEAFRADNGGKLVFAVDVNENASGLETARSQGVAVKSVALVVTFANGTKTYSQFSTETQALIAEAGSKTRQPFYTLLGDAGSNEITPRRIDSQAFDSTIKIVVADNLSTATAAVLTVQLLNTDPRLGDPENFYDYSGGFEDLAIVTKASADYLDRVLPIPQNSTFRSEAPAVELSPEGQITQSTLLASATATTTPTATQIVAASTPLSWIQRPGASSYNIVAYEDLYPNRGDYDFNDAVVAYRYQLGVNSSGQVEQIQGEAYLVARGSNYTHNWTLEIPVPPGTSLASTSNCSTVDSARTTAPCAITLMGGALSWQAFSGTRILLPPGSQAQRNTMPGESPIQGPKSTFLISFTTPVALANIGVDDPWLHVIDTGKDIHTNARDANGFPFAMNIPSDWQVPNEGVDLGLAYPSFSTFVTSSGGQSADWYLKPNSGRIQNWKVQDWAWW